MDLSKLKEPFPAEDVEWRLGQCGKNARGFWAKCLAYVTNRGIMNRLDAVCGPENWRNEFAPWPVGGKAGQLCGISILIPTLNPSPFAIGQWITKWDGAEQTDIEPVKGGLSDAMKRAAVQWGIGRYLYDLEEGWATIVDDNDKSALRGQTKDKEPFRWRPPALPAWALPAAVSVPETTAARATPKPDAMKDFVAAVKAGTQERKLKGLGPVDATLVAEAILLRGWPNTGFRSWTEFKEMVGEERFVQLTRAIDMAPTKFAVETVIGEEKAS